MRRGFLSMEYMIAAVILLALLVLALGAQGVIPGFKQWALTNTNQSGGPFWNAPNNGGGSGGGGGGGGGSSGAEGDSCSSDTDCNSGLICVGGTCADSCDDVGGACTSINNCENLGGNREDSFCPCAGCTETCCY